MNIVTKSLSTALLSISLILRIITCAHNFLRLSYAVSGEILIVSLCDTSVTILLDHDR